MDYTKRKWSDLKDLSESFCLSKLRRTIYLCPTLPNPTYAITYRITLGGKYAGYVTIIIQVDEAVEVDMTLPF